MLGTRAPSCSGVERKDNDPATKLRRLTSACTNLSLLRQTGEHAAWGCLTFTPSCSGVERKDNEPATKLRRLTSACTNLSLLRQMGEHAAWGCLTFTPSCSGVERKDNEPATKLRRLTSACTNLSLLRQTDEHAAWGCLTFTPSCFGFCSTAFSLLIRSKGLEKRFVIFKQAIAHAISVSYSSRWWMKYRNPINTNLW